MESRRKAMRMPMWLDASLGKIKQPRGAPLGGGDRGLQGALGDGDGHAQWNEESPGDLRQAVFSQAAAYGVHHARCVRRDTFA